MRFITRFLTLSVSLAATFTQAQYTPNTPFQHVIVASRRTFAPFTQGINYGTECFIVPQTTQCFGTNFTASDPDADDADQD